MNRKKLAHKAGDHLAGIETYGITCDGVIDQGEKLESCDRVARHQYWLNSEVCRYFCDAHMRLYAESLASDLLMLARLREMTHDRFNP